MTTMHNRYLIGHPELGLLDFASRKSEARTVAENWWHDLTDQERHDIYIDDLLAHHRQPNSWKRSPHGPYWVVDSYKV